MLKNIDANHSEQAALLQAKDEIEGVVLELNEQKRQAEEMEKLMQTLSKIKSDEVTNITARQQSKALTAFLSPIAGGSRDLWKKSGVRRVRDCH